MPPPRSAEPSSDISSYRVLHGYPVVGRLGRGAVADVWAALMPSAGRVVALKHRFDCPCRRAHGRGRMPAVDLTKLVHPHLLATFVFGPGYTVSELADGGTVETQVRRAGTPASEARARWVADVGAQVASALGYLHDQELVHRDVKPANVLVTTAAWSGSDRPMTRLGDFDLLASQGVHRAVSGTPGFLAPEQARPGPVDGRADLYALGQTLAQLWTGHSPDAGARRPSSRTAGGSAGRRLAGILRGLARTRAEERVPATAAELCVQLAELSGASPSRPIADVTVVGRDEVLARVAARLQGLRAGRPYALVVHGARAVGRSAVLAAAARYARALEIPVYRGLPRAGEHPPLLLLDDLERRPPAELRTVRTALRVLGMHTRASAELATSIIAAVADDDRFGARLVRELGDLGAELVAIGPLDAAGSEELVERSFAARPIDELAQRQYRASGGLPGLLLFAGDVSEQIARLPEDEREVLSWLALVRDPLRRHKLRAMEHELDQLTRRGLVRSSRGWVELTARAVGDAIVTDLSRADKRRLACGISQVLQPARRSRLRLELAAMAEDRAALAELGATLEVLAKRGAWEELDECVDRVAEASMLGAGERAQLALYRARSILARPRAGRRPEDAEQAALSAYREATTCGDLSVQIDALQVAAEAAEAGGDKERQRERFQRSLEIAGDGADAARRIRALIALGRSDDALAEAIAARDPVSEAQAKLAISLDALGAGDIERARQLLAEAERLAREVDERPLLVRVLHRQGRLLYSTGRFSAPPDEASAEQSWRSALDLCAPGIVLTSEIALRNNLALTLWKTERLAEAAQQFREAVWRCRSIGFQGRAVQALNNLLIVELRRLRPHEALNAGRQALELACSIGDRENEALVRSNLTHVAMFLGDDDQAEAEATANHAIAIELDHRRFQALSLRNQSDVFARRAIVHRRAAQQQRQRLRLAAGLADRATDNLDREIQVDQLALEPALDGEQLARLQQIAADAAAGGDLALEAKAVRTLAIALARLDRRGEAERVLEEALDRHPDPQLGEPRMQLEEARCRVTGRDVTYSRYADTIDAIARALGPEWGESFRARNDVALVLVDGVARIAPCDLVEARRLAELAGPCRELSWRADAHIARAARDKGAIGIEEGHRQRGRALLAAHEAVRMEAELTPALAPLVVELTG